MILYTTLDGHASCELSGMSFLDVQDLATVAAQTDITAILMFRALEAGFGACLIALAIRRRVKH